MAWRSPWQESLADPGAWAGSDFQILLAAGVAQSRGLDAHDAAVLDAVGRELGRPATPFCAAPPLVVAVFGTLGDELEPAFRRWLTIQALCAVLAAACLFGVCRRAGFGALGGAAAALGVLALGDGLWMSAAMNSTNLVALLALAAALLAAVHDRPALEGLALAVAILAKTSPALVVVAALLSGRRRTVLWSALGLAALVGLGVAWVGWDVHVSWWQRVLPALGYAPELPPGHFDNGLHQWNLAPHGLLARAAWTADLPRAFVGLGAWAVTALVVVQLGLALRGARVAGDAVLGRVREYGLAVAGSLLVSSVTWPHHLVLAALPALALVVTARARGWRRVDVVLGGAACVVLAQPLGTWGATGEQPADILAYAAGCVLLFMGLAAGAGRAEPAEAT